METNDKLIGSRILKKMKSVGMTQVELCQKTGMTPKSVNQIIKGITQPRRSNLIAIAEAIGCSVDEFYGVPLWTISDAAEILSLFAKQSPLRQSFVMAFLKRDASLFVSPTPELSQAVQILLKSH